MRVVEAGPGERVVCAVGWARFGCGGGEVRRWGRGQRLECGVVVGVVRERRRVRPGVEVEVSLKVRSGGGELVVVVEVKPRVVVALERRQ
jgi:hypothetical protein